MTNNILNREKVREIALKYGYKEIDREKRESGYLITFRHPNMSVCGCGESDRKSAPVVINVWFAPKGTVCIYLDEDHLNSAPTQILRPNGADCDLLERIFENPRVNTETGKGSLDHLTEDLISEFEDTFFLFDKNEDGTILSTELGTVSARLVTR